MIKKIYDHFMNDSLYRNSIYLMASTVVMSGFGFIFWIINARLFTTEQIGIGSTLISVITLIVTFSMLGLNSGIIRFLPTSDRKNDKINTVFTITGLVAVLLSTIFILTVNIFSPTLVFLKHNLYFAIFFIFSIVGMALFTIIESVCIAYRRAELVLLKNFIFSLGKVVLPFILVSFGAMGIFGSWTISAIIGFLVIFFIFIFKLNYVFEPYFYDSIIKKIMSYSFGNYVAGFISALPLMLFPLIITHKLGPTTTAYYYIAITIAGLLFSVPNAITSSLFAEGSNNAKEMRKIVKKSVKFISLIMIPAILIIFFLGNYILLIFGKNYSVEGFEFLQLLAVSAIFVSINAIYSTVFKVEKRIKEIIIINIISVVLIFILAYALLYKGLLGVGIGWIIGNILISLMYIFMSWKFNRT